jgi:two-component system, NarL family, nitrate/nitrite response regulator NarL
MSAEEAMLHVLVVDDTRLCRDGLIGMLQHEPSIASVGAAADADSALRHLSQASTDVVLLNMMTEGSVVVCRAIVAAAPRARVIALAVSGAYEEVIAYAEAGVAGYLLREEPLANLMAVIQSVARGEMLCSPRVAATLLRRVANTAAERRSTSDLDHLTTREQEVLRLLEEGLSNKEIARCLSIEVRTVKNHVHNILEKLRVHRRGEAAALLRTRAFPSPLPRPTVEALGD